MRGEPDFAEAIAALFETRGAPMIDLPIIQPADPFLDMAGEDLRRRIFMTESETGESLCLRPEFTIPVCRRHIDMHADAPRRYGYLGRVFRQRREGGSEFFQSGIEDLGDGDVAAADACAIRDAADALALLLPNAGIGTMIGDQSVFEAVVAALGLPEGWQIRLVRAFGDRAQLDLLLKTLSEPAGELRGADAEMARLAHDGDPAALTARIEERMRATGHLGNASRTPAEIAERLIAKARLADARLDARELGILKDFLALEAPLDDALPALRSFAGGTGLDLGPALDSFEARMAALSSCGAATAGMRYRAAFGRPLDYYSGLVFEMAVNGAVLAGGGRYDRLPVLLGASKPVPAVGFSLWLDRIGMARAAEAGS